MRVTIVLLKIIYTFNILFLEDSFLIHFIF